MAETLTDKRLAAAETAALAPAPAAAPAAPPKPATQGNGLTGAQAEARMKELTAPAPAPAPAPSLMQRVKGLVGLSGGGLVPGYDNSKAAAPAPAPDLSTYPNAFDKQRQNAFSLLAKGGKIPGKGSGDKVPVMAEPGEYMVKKSAVPVANAAVKKAGFKSLDHLNRSTHNPDNRVPASAKHKPGSRGGAMAGMKCGGKVK